MINMQKAQLCLQLMVIQLTHVNPAHNDLHTSKASLCSEQSGEHSSHGAHMSFDRVTKHNNCMQVYP